MVGLVIFVWLVTHSVKTCKYLNFSNVSWDLLVGLYVLAAFFVVSIS